MPNMPGFKESRTQRIKYEHSEVIREPKSGSGVLSLSDATRVLWRSALATHFWKDLIRWQMLPQRLEWLLFVDDYQDSSDRTHSYLSSYFSEIGQTNKPYIFTVVLSRKLGAKSYSYCLSLCWTWESTFSGREPSKCYMSVALTPNVTSHI